MHIHANELQVPLTGTPAAFFVGHVFATWAASVGEAIVHQGHLALTVWIHILSCQVPVNILVFMEKLQSIQQPAGHLQHVSL